MEFGLHEEFPIYAGGLGVLAGDFLKAAQDLGLPVVGVGLRWARGYSRQRIGDDGVPVDEFPEYDAGFLADTGARVRVRVAAREVELRVWRTDRWGNAPLFLLEPVAEEDTWITHRLYEPRLDRRVAQEILLGVGGVRALAALGLEVDTYHFNEGHAVFGGIAMIADRMALGAAFPAAWADVRRRIGAARGAPDALWAAHQALKRETVEDVAARTGVRLDPDVLTLGFARRAAGYKRADLIFSDPARIEPLLAGRRLQLVFAGKAHPDDGDGRQIVATLVAMARRHPGAVVFVHDYGMAIGRSLTRGVDVWLNNPLRPLEACGTSGMKAALNGAINVSILDGWWPEACRHGENGWAIGDRGEPDHARDVDALYATLEREVLPAWADRARWLAMMQASIATVEERFSAARMVREYFARLYARG